MKETPEHLHRGGRVWAPSLQVPGTWQLSSVVGPSSDGGVRLRPLNEYGEDRSLPPSELLPANPPMMDAAADLTSLTYLNAPSVLDVLRTRARQGDIYSSAGPVLVAVNPLRDIPGLYGEERMEDYRLGRQSLRPPRAVGATGGTGQADGVGGAASQADAPPSSAPAPHVYGVAEAAYRDLCEGRGSQSILITGESGAGKTETTKHALRYISRVAGSSRRGLERAVLGSNPLLEAFGNASTQHNANSSRFGKLISLRFDAARRVTSACVDAYLLEKSRVVAHLPGERAFHVFYQMCAGATVDERARWRLPPSAAAFAYLCGPGAPFPSRADDAPAFAELRRAMEALDLDFERQDAIFQLLAGILWLGNVQFEACGDGDRASAATPTSHAAKASSPRPSTPAAGASPKAHPTADAGGRVIPASCPALELAAGLLGLDARALEEALTWRRMRVGAESLRLPRGVRGAGDARDALAKGLYASLFEWLVSRVNAVLLRGGREADEGAAAEEIPSGPSLSILDIYGFECFGVNSLEQLCINLANERLQQHFNDCLCAAEQETYAREGVEWRRIDWEDNADVIALLLARPPQPAGVLALLDEECLFPGGSDASFAAKLAQLLTGHPRFLTPGRGSVSRSPSLDPSRGSGSPALAPALSPMLPGSALPLPATSPPAARSFRRSRAGPGGPRTPRSPAAEAARQPAGDFAVRHTAGEVAYCCGGFLDKNRDALPPELGALLAASGAPLVALLSADLASDASDRRVGGSLAVRFREQLEALIRTLRATRPRFVRCVRPNASQARGVWEDALVLRQLRCCGVMEVVRIAAAGFPTRYRHARFAAMYAPLLAGGADRLRRCVGEAEGWGDGEADQEIPPPPMKPSSPELLELCADVLRRFGVERGDYQVGRSLLLFRPGVLGALESRAQRARRAAVVVQACWRGSRARRQLRVARGAAAALQAAWRGVLARREALARRRRRDAALALQAAWRACLAKKALRRLRMELQERRRREEEAKRVEEEARRAEERARRSEERARRSEEELARREASEAAAAMRVHSNPLAEEEEEEDAAEGDAASSVAALQAALEASEAHRAALARQLRDSRAESELLRRALRTLGDEEDPAPAGAAGVKPEAPADPLSPPSPSQPPPGAVAPQRIRAAVLDAATRGGAADGAESPAATSTASSQTPSSSQVGVGWAAAARSGSQRAESDGNGGVSGASGVAASLGAELARKGSLFDDDASFIVEVFRGEAAAPGMDPGAELAQLRQRYALWKAGFKARLQEAERALRGEGRKGRKRGEEAAGRKESFLGRVLQRGAKATAVAQ